MKKSNLVIGNKYAYNNQGSVFVLIGLYKKLAWIEWQDDDYSEVDTLALDTKTLKSIINTKKNKQAP